MPLFEYKCNDCKKIFEILHKSTNSKEKIECPECKSENYTKLFSSFAASVKGEASFSYNDSSCSNGSCCMNDNGHCGNS